MGDDSGNRSSLVSCAFNPLAWPSVGAVLGDQSGTVAAPALLEFLHGPFAKTSLDEVRNRYHDLAAVEKTLLAVPAHPRLFNGIVVPLHNAKAAYVIGHYLSCIALAGVICEMLALFRFEIASVHCAGKPLDAERQQLLWGKTFEMLGQRDRIGALEALGLVDRETVTALNDVQGIRRRYMHFLRDDRPSEEADARKAYSLAIDVCITVVGGKLEDGSFSLRFHPDLVRWLGAKGLLKTPPA